MKKPLTPSTARTGLRYEILIRSLLSEKLKLTPFGDHDIREPEVVHRKRYTGISGQVYEVDLSFEFHLSGFRFLVVLECKSRSRNVEVGTVLAFATKVRDLGAQKGVLVSDSGFDPGAIRIAKANEIALVEAGKTTWRQVTECRTYIFDFIEAISRLVRKRPKASFRVDDSLQQRTLHLLRSAVGVAAPASWLTEFLPIRSRSVLGLMHLGRLDDEELSYLLSALQPSLGTDWDDEPLIAFKFVAQSPENDDELLLFGPGALLSTLVTTEVCSRLSAPLSWETPAEAESIVTYERGVR